MKVRFIRSQFLVNNNNNNNDDKGRLLFLISSVEVYMAAIVGDTWENSSPFQCLSSTVRRFIVVCSMEVFASLMLILPS